MAGLSERVGTSLNGRDEFSTLGLERKEGDYSELGAECIEDGML